jgi:hypothetical protein
MFVTQKATTPSPIYEEDLLDAGLALLMAEDEVPDTLDDVLTRRRHI